MPELCSCDVSGDGGPLLSSFDYSRKMLAKKARGIMDLLVKAMNADVERSKGLQNIASQAGAGEGATCEAGRRCCNHPGAGLWEALYFAEVAISIPENPAS